MLMSLHPLEESSSDPKISILLDKLPLKIEHTRQICVIQLWEPLFFTVTLLFSLLPMNLCLGFELPSPKGKNKQQRYSNHGVAWMQFFIWPLDGNIAPSLCRKQWFSVCMIQSGEKRQQRNNYNTLNQKRDRLKHERGNYMRRKDGN